MLQWHIPPYNTFFATLDTALSQRYVYKWTGDLRYVNAYSVNHKSYRLHGELTYHLNLLQHQLRRPLRLNAMAEWIIND